MSLIQLSVQIMLHVLLFLNNYRKQIEDLLNKPVTEDGEYTPNFKPGKKSFFSLCTISFQMI